MPKKRFLVAAAIMVGVICAGLVVCAKFSPSSSGVTKVNFDRISKGMTRTEIEEIFNWGKGPGLWAEAGFGDPGEPREQRKQGEWVWGGDDGVALAMFDSDGKAIFVQWTDRPRTFLQKLRTFIPF